MSKQGFSIGRIPAVLWGDASDRVIIAVHGSQSNKTDTPIAMLAETALKKGYQVLSFDLPEHGDRKDDPLPCKVQFCREDLEYVMRYAKARWRKISLFANSLGAYFSLLAFREEALGQALFLSPVVDMRRMIENMMGWFQVTPERLEAEQEVPTPIGQTLYWDYYCYVKEHPVDRWDTPTAILYGGVDQLCEPDPLSAFVERFHCRLDVLEGGEHYFHTEEQLAVFDEWLEKRLTAEQSR